MYYDIQKRLHKNFLQKDIYYYIQLNIFQTSDTLSHFLF